MKLIQKFLALSVCVVASSAVVAKPMPNSISVDDKAIVPIVKTQIIRTVKGQAPVRTVEATIFEVSNKGQDIVARDVVLQDNESTFSERQMSNPVLKKGGLIVPTSKIELTTTVKQGTETISENKTIDASGVEFKKDQTPIRRDLKLQQQTSPDSREKMSHAVISENGVVTKDVVVFDENK